MLNLTSRAAEHIKKLQEDGWGGEFLRVYVQGGGCHGMTYGMTFETEPDGEVFFLEGVKVLVDSQSAMILSDAVIDYEDGLEGKGFVFKNPKAKSHCGCESSFS